MWQMPPSSYALDDNTLSFVSSANSLPTLILALLAQDKSNVTQDENLLMEQFGQALVHMIPFMHDYGWDPSNVKMHFCFWSVIENHK